MRREERERVARGLVGEERVVDHCGLDVGPDGGFVDGLTVLTPTRLVTRVDGDVEEVSIEAVGKSEVRRGRGVDRWVVEDAGGGRLFEAAFTGRHRAEAHRVARRLARAADPTSGDAWLEKAERLPDEGEDHEDVAESKAVLWRLLEVARPYRGWVGVALGLTVLSGVLNVVPAYLTRYVIDSAINPQTAGDLPAAQRAGNLLFWSSMYALAIGAMLLAIWGRLLSLSWIAGQVCADLRERAYAHLHDLSLRYFGKHRVGSLITRVTSDTDRLWEFIVFGSVDFVKNVLMMVTAGGLMLWANWRLGLVALAPMPVVMGLAWWKTRVLMRTFGRLWGLWSRLTAVVGDALPGVKVIKAFGSEAREVERFAAESRGFAVDEYEAVRVWVNLQPTVEGAMMLSRVAILIAGGYLIIYGDPARGDTIGTLFMFLAVVGFFHMAIMDITQKQRAVVRAATSAQRVFEVLDTEAEITTPENPHRPERLEGRVTFEDVGFSYDGAKPTLAGVSVDVEPGMMVGLCGSSGAGKSTFVNLISRFYDATAGRVMIDGVDVRAYDLAWLRSHVGVVLQEPYLFYGSVADNIRYGRPEASDAEVIAAARAANAHEFIMKAPDAYDTVVGERGQSLSGGERQRVSIARAILHNPKILILDEATSSVDTETERQIQQALDRLVAGRTTFAIAHRLSTIRSADLLLVLDEGKVVERGTHDTLLAAGGTYAKLVDTQLTLATDGMADAAPAHDAA